MLEVEIGSLELPVKGSFKIGPFGSSLKVHELVPKGIPVLGIENVHTNLFTKRFRRFITKDKFRELLNYKVQTDDILVSTMGTIGRAAIVPNGVGTAIYDGHLFRMRTDPTKVYPQYLCFAINGYDGLLQQLNRQSRGAIMDGLNTTILRECKIPLPNLPDQKRIAAILDKADRLHRQRRFAQALSDSFLQSIFIKMFGDPFTNPYGFKADCLKHILQMTPQNGLYAPAESYCDVKDKSGTEMVHMSDLFYDVVDRGHLKRVKLNEKEVKKYNLDQRDVLLARRSLNYEGAAKPCLIPKSHEPLVFESSMIRLRTDASKIIPIYLYYYLSNERARNAHVLKYITRSTISGINQDNLNQINVIIPTMDLQEKFAAIVQKFERIRRQQREATRQAEHLFQTLLRRAFNGQL